MVATTIQYDSFKLRTGIYCENLPTKFLHVLKLTCRIYSEAKDTAFFSILIWVLFHKHQDLQDNKGKGKIFFNSSLPFPPASRLERGIFYFSKR